MIGNDVWIGYEALIMPGVKVGNGAIIASRSVVTSDVPAYTVVGGNPAKPVRARFAPEVVAQLESLAWWDQSPAWITAHLGQIVSGDVEALLACQK
ncbi:serine acetyltransferase [Pantoea ananatis]|nr:serine acetyltransferase [Pantoea ananatis]